MKAAKLLKKEHTARRLRRTERDPAVERLAEFLNIDLNSASDERWGVYRRALSCENVDRSGATMLAEDEWQQAKKLAASLELLDEADLCRVGLVSELKGLQQRLRSELAPVIGAKDIASVRGQLTEIIRTLNALNFTVQWALYTLEQGQGEEPKWCCYYDPEKGSTVREASMSEMFGQKFLTIKPEPPDGEQQMCAKTVFARQSR